MRKSQCDFGVHLSVQVDTVFLMPFPAGCLAAPSDPLLKPSAKTGCFSNDSLFEAPVGISEELSKKPHIPLGVG